jgi:hypothetical protein
MIRSRLRALRWSALAFAITAAAASADTVTLTELPTPENPIFGTSKIASDGTVVGSNIVAGNVLRWMPGQPADDLGGHTMTVENILPLIDKTGRTIVAAYNFGPEDNAPAQWMGGADWERLPGLVLGVSRPYGMSFDGSHVVGGGDSPAGGGTYTPWIWDATNGQVVLGVPDGVAGGQAWAVSNDGTIAAGLIAPNPSDPFAVVGARWVDGVPEYLTDVDGNSLGQAVACDETCSVVIGYAGAASNQAWRWTAADGAEYLGELSSAAPGSTYVAIAASRDAHVIVGSYFAFDQTLGNVNRPFLWTPADHLQDLVEWLATNGIDYGAGFHDLVANSVTPDGRKILLNGVDENDAHRSAVITIVPPDMIFSDGFDFTPI